MGNYERGYAAHYPPEPLSQGQYHDGHFCGWHTTTLARVSVALSATDAWMRVPHDIYVSIVVPICELPMVLCRAEDNLRYPVGIDMLPIGSHETFFPSCL